jgi:hypothetical protein
LVAIGARNVKDDDLLGLLGGESVEFFLTETGDGVEELVGDIGHDSGAARSNAVLGEEEQKTGEEIVDGSGGLELGEAFGESGGEVAEFGLILREFSVLRAKLGAGSCG